jgi:hypothetical protein
MGGTAGVAFQISAQLASDVDPRAPTTVGLIDWSTTLGTPTAAVIEFGLTADYGMEAPVDVTAASLRGVLLGMKPSQTYHFRVSATVAGQVVASEDQTLQTGAPPARTFVTSYSVLSAAEREPGFILTSTWQQQVGGMVFILDQDGDVVWWYEPDLEDGVARAAISADGRDLWMVSPNIGAGEPLVRVGLDGLGPEKYANTSGSHDIIPLENDVMAFIEYLGSGTGVGVSEVDRSGELVKVLREEDLPPAAPGSPLGLHHLNALAYDGATGTYAVSSLLTDVYLFPRVGVTSENIVALTTISGPNTGWGTQQHGVELLPGNHLLMFANSGVEDPLASAVLELDLSDGSEVWRYVGGEHTGNFGGVQRLPGGNTLVTYSNVGVIHETTRESEKVLEIVAAPPALGYATWLPSLYARGAR